VEGVPNPIDSATSLLTVGTDLAIKLGLATGKASSVEQLATDRHLNITQILRSGFGEAAIAWFNSEWVRMMLMMVCGVAVYTAMHAPGHGTAEALVVTTLGLLLGVPLLAGYANWWEILLILGGLAMIAFEIFVFPHAGLMILSGLLMMLVGLVLTFVPAEPGGFRLVPNLSGTRVAIKHGMGFVTGGLIGAGLLSAWVSRFLPKLPYFRRLVLQTVNGEPMNAGEAIPTVSWPTVGALGRAVTPLRPGGSAEFPNAAGSDVKIFSVVSESGFLAEGSPVVVREVGGGRVVVRSTVA
jgi:membrane-bound serine protease (ClpP class)